MNRVFAVAVKDLRQQGRFAGLYIMRSVYAVGATIAIWALIPTFLVLGMTGLTPTAAAVAVQFWFTIWALTQGVLALAWATAGAEGMSRERSARTLRLLHLTHVRPVELLLGKLLADLCALGVLYLAPVPVLILLSWLGGLSLFSAFEATLLAVTIGLVGLSLGSLLGTRLGSARAILTTASILLVVGVGVLFWDDARSLLAGYHPLLALWEVAMQLPAASRQSSTFAAAAVNFAAALLFLGCASLLVKQTDREEVVQERTVSGKGEPRPVQGNPIAWLVKSSALLPSPYPYALLAAGFGAFFLVFVPAHAADDLILALVGLATGTYLCLAPLFWTSGIFRVEKGDPLLTQLAGLPLRGRTIALGQLEAAFRSYVIALLPLLPFLAVVLLREGLSVLWTILCLFHVLGFSVLALELGLFFSVRMRKRLKTFFAALFFVGWIYAALASFSFGLTAIAFTVYAILLPNYSVGPEFLAQLYLALQTVCLLLVAVLFLWTDGRYMELELGRAV